jgi:hypothetical protein
MFAPLGNAQLSAFVLHQQVFANVTASQRVVERELLVHARKFVSSSSARNSAAESLSECQRMLISLGLATRCVCTALPVGIPQWLEVCHTFATAASRFAEIAERSSCLSQLLDTCFTAQLLGELLCCLSAWHCDEKEQACAKDDKEADVPDSGSAATLRQLLHAAADLSSCNWKPLKTILAMTIPAITRLGEDTQLVVAEKHCPWRLQLFRFVGNACYGSTASQLIAAADGAMLFKDNLMSALVQAAPSSRGLVDALVGAIFTAYNTMTSAPSTETSALAPRELPSLGAIPVARWACHALSNLCYGGAPSDRQEALVAKWACHLHVSRLLFTLGMCCAERCEDLKVPLEEASIATVSLAACTIAAAECLTNLLFRHPFSMFSSSMVARLPFTSDAWSTAASTRCWGHVPLKTVSLLHRTLESGNWFALSE